MWIYLQPSKMFVESYVLGINTFTCRKVRQCKGAWKHVQTRHSLYISGSMDMRESNERPMGNKRVFSHILRVFREFYSLYTWTFVFMYFKTFERWCFRFCSIKKSRTFNNENQFQILSRPLNRTPEIQGLSRCILTLKWTY